MASKKYRNHSCKSFCYVKMHVQQERLYFLFAFFFLVVIHGDCCDRKHPKQLFDSSKTCTTISYRRIARFDAILKTYAANFMRIIAASVSRLSCLGPVFRPLQIRINTAFRNSYVISMFQHFLDKIKN